MAHDDPFAGKRVHADWAFYLDTAGTYAPTLTATTTNPNLGADGEAVGFWHRNGHLITAHARFLFSGTGADPGSGTYEISLPFNADESLYTASTITGLSALGAGTTRDSSAVTASRPVVPFLTAASAVRLQFGDGYLVTDANPFIWADGDRIAVQFIYIADPAGLPS